MHGPYTAPSLRSATNIIATDSSKNSMLIALRIVWGEILPYKRGPIWPPIRTPGMS
jgi:hypothetical protein